MNFFSPKEECGIFGIYNCENAAGHTALGLHALQHRGQESAGIVSYDGQMFHIHKAMGLVSKVFSKPDLSERLVGNMAIGHVRYSTSGDTISRNIQPLVADYALGGIAIAHNGNLTNAWSLRDKLVARGSIFQSSSDTEVIIHLLATSIKERTLDRFIDAISHIQGAYSLIALTRKKLIGLRDPLGVRPLVIGKLGNSWLLASETTALNIIGAEFIRDVEPGEIVWFDSIGMHSNKPFREKSSKFCIFEYVYFSRPDSKVEGLSVNEVRKAIGRELAKESPVDADIVVPIPDSGLPAAIGYSHQSGIPFEMGIIRNHFIGRTFIEPTQEIRNLSVKKKHLPCKSSLDGKRVILVDDSIVRGTTSQKLIDMVRGAGAKEVHMRVAAPPTQSPCFYGIDTPTEEELIASKFNLDLICTFIGADSLAYLSINGLYRAVCGSERNQKNPQYCDACFTKDYPIKLVDKRAEKNVGTLMLEVADERKNNRKKPTKNNTLE